MLKRFLWLAGGAIVVFVVSVILHNAISALLGLEEPVFFVVAVILAPLAFVIGVAGAAVATVVQWSRQSARGTGGKAAGGASRPRADS